MEIEYKFALDSPEQGEMIIADVEKTIKTENKHDITMSSAYYDNESGSLSGAGYSLRIRQENELTVCCIKRTSKKLLSGLSRREEYEFPCTGIEDAVEKMADNGIPEKAAALCRQNLVTIAHICYTRTAMTADTGDAVCEIAFDRGRFGSGEAICEIELEFVSGSENGFMRFARSFGKKYSLSPQNLSKLARAVFLQSGRN